eukprot:Sdes_comp9198_c0_seq1m674
MLFFNTTQRIKSFPSRPQLEYRNLFFHRLSIPTITNAYSGSYHLFRGYLCLLFLPLLTTLLSFSASSIIQQSKESGFLVICKSSIYPSILFYSFFFFDQ